MQCTDVNQKTEKKECFIWNFRATFAYAQGPEHVPRHTFPMYEAKVRWKKIRRELHG